VIRKILESIAELELKPSKGFKKKGPTVGDLWEAMDPMGFSPGPGGWDSPAQDGSWGLTWEPLHPDDFPGDNALSMVVGNVMSDEHPGQAWEDEKVSALPLVSVDTLRMNEDGTVGEHLEYFGKDMVERAREFVQALKREGPEPAGDEVGDDDAMSENLVDSTLENLGFEGFPAERDTWGNKYYTWNHDSMDLKVFQFVDGDKATVTKLYVIEQGKPEVQVKSIPELEGLVMAIEVANEKKPPSWNKDSVYLTLQELEYSVISTVSEPELDNDLGKGYTDAWGPQGVDNNDVVFVYVTEKHIGPEEGQVEVTGVFARKGYDGQIVTFNPEDDLTRKIREMK